MSERGISFEQVVMHIERGDVLDIFIHPNPEKYPKQQIIVVEINEYAYLVPLEIGGQYTNFEIGGHYATSSLEISILSPYFSSLEISILSPYFSKANS